MNSEIVVDSSIAIGWVRESQVTSHGARLLETIKGGSVLVVPALWFLEMANTLVLLQRRGKIGDEDRLSAIERLKTLPVTVDQTGTGLAWSTLSSLALECGLTVYDAVYLELAARRNASLATNDLDLSAAARTRGVQLWE